MKCNELPNLLWYFFKMFGLLSRQLISSPSSTIIGPFHYVVHWVVCSTSCWCKPRSRSLVFSWHSNFSVDSVAQNKEIRKYHYPEPWWVGSLLCSHVRHYLSQTKPAVSRQMLSCPDPFLQKQSSPLRAACYMLLPQLKTKSCNETKRWG